MRDGLTAYGTTPHIAQVAAAGLAGDAASFQVNTGVFNASRAARAAV